MTNERKTVTDKFHEDWRCMLDGISIDAGIEYLMRLKHKYPNGVFGVRDVMWSDEEEGCVTVERQETDEEMNIRLQQEAEWKSKRRKQYEELKKEFGDS